VPRIKKLPLETLAPYLVARADPPQLFAWETLFGNAHPVELEVGFGKGMFLIAAATAHPEINYLGIEIDRGLQLYTAGRLAKRGLANVKLLQGDARLVLRDQVPADSLRAIHLYFPDPWWKARHKKRRVFTPEFARQCGRTLSPGGQLHIATDVAEYFEVMQECLRVAGGLSAVAPQPRHPPAHEMDYQTNFERKAGLQGRPVWRASYQKPGSPTAANQR